MTELPPRANLRVKDVAAFLDISTSAVYDMINEGILPHLQIIGTKRIPREEFLIWYRNRIAKAEE